MGKHNSDSPQKKNREARRAEKRLAKQRRTTPRQPATAPAQGG